MTSSAKMTAGRALLLVFVCLVFTILFSTGLAAEEAPVEALPPEAFDGPADLLGVYRLARENDPTFRSETFRYETSPEIMKQARSDLLPSVGLDLYYSESKHKIKDTDVAVYGTGEADYPSQGYTLELRQPLFEWETFKRYAQAKAEVKLAGFEFQAARQDLFMRVAEAYIGALAAYDNLDFARAEEEDLKFHLDLAEERYHSGLATVLDFHDAKARHAYVTARRVKAEYELEDALEALAEMTGARSRTLARLTFTAAEIDLAASPPPGRKKAGDTALHAAIETIPLTEPDPDAIGDWVDRAMDQNFQVQVKQQQVRIAAREIERQRGGHVPDLELIARTSRDDTRGSLFGGSSDVEEHEVLFQLNVPLYEGGAVRSRTREALKQHEAMKAELEKERRAARRETMAAFLGVKGAIKNTIALSQSVISSRIALETKREGYRAGMFPSLVVSDAERDYYQAKRDFAQAQYEYIRNSLRLKKAVSTLTEADLAEINQWLQ